MKHLFLLRHAKSSWDDLDLSDFDRPLNNRGEKAAPRIGKEMKKRAVTPDLILCSPSRRTKETLNLVVESAELVSAPVSFCDEIYEASVKDLLRVLHKQNKSHGSILMIGHNPGMESLLLDLTGEFEHFPTAALASIDIEVDSWKDLSRGVGQLKWILRPKELER
ncbi:MAG: histidine phosphatase family protein [Cyanobacteria bacterium]|nr:histidine phosphatase family protein [Cyanobacteriota bacterium]